MTPREYLQALRDWPVLAGLVVGLLGAALFTWVSTPKYAASTTLFVSAQGVQNDVTKAYQGNQLSTEKVKTYTALIMSDRVRAGASDRLDTTINPGQVTATAQAETVLITVTATDTFPQRAQHIADAVGTEFIAFLTQLEKPVDNVNAPPSVIVRVIQPAQLPTQPISPRPKLNLAVGALLGLLLGYSLALLRYVMNPPQTPTEQTPQNTHSRSPGTSSGTRATEPIPETPG